MTNLPAEVLRMVFSQLVTRDHLECMTVCREWHRIIYNHSLFRVIYIRFSKNLKQLIEKVLQDPSLGAKVEKLMIRYKHAPEYDTKFFNDLFPNLREFTSLNKRIITGNPKPTKQNDSLPWCNHIQKITETMTDINTRTLLLSGTCKNLTYIWINKSNGSGTQLITSLSNAPALKTLHVERYRITFKHLEVLHETVPLLNSLSLENTTTGNLPLPLVIEPAKSIKCFSYISSMVKYGSNHNPYIEYICQKYTHLNELTLQIDPIVFNEGWEPNASMALTNNVIASYMKTLSPRLKILTLRRKHSETFNLREFNFSALDGSGCRIERLNMFEPMTIPCIKALSETTQVQHIRSLVLGINYQHSRTLTYLEWLKSFKVLKQLSLWFYIPTYSRVEHPLPLTDLLNALTECQLETLALDDMSLKGGDPTINSVYPSLKQLTLSNLKIEAGTDLAISQIFPNLKRLVLASCFHEQTKFTLPTTALSYLEVSFLEVASKGSFNVVVKTLENKQERIYNVDKQVVAHGFGIQKVHTDNLPFPYCLSQLYSKRKNNWLLKVVCKSVYNVSITNRDFSNTIY